MADWIQLTEATTGRAVAFAVAAVTQVSEDPAGAVVYVGGSSTVVRETYEDVLQLLDARHATVASRKPTPGVGVSEVVARGRDKRGATEEHEATDDA